MGALAPMDAIKRRGDERSLSAEERRLVAQLARRDRAVRAREADHVAIGTTLVHLHPAYTYQCGPDGGYYAIGREMTIDMGPGHMPAAPFTEAEALDVSACTPATFSVVDRTGPPPGGDTVAVAAIADRSCGFALAVIRFYHAVAAGVRPRPSVDVFA